MSDIYLYLNISGTSKFWIVSIRNEEKLENCVGLTFFTISDSVTTFLVGYSVTGFYLGVVYLIGRGVRSGLAGGEQNLTITDLPKASNIIQICEGVLIARADKNLQK